MANVLAFSCLHIPFDLPDFPDFLNEIRQKYKCDKIMNLGDEVDFHRISFHPAEPDAMGAKEEHALAVHRYKKYQKVFKGFDYRNCFSNHSSRPFRLASSVGIPDDFIREYQDFLDTPKSWRWAERWVIDHVLYMHGEGYSGETPHLKCAMKNRISCVIGHNHRSAGVNYHASFVSLVFGMSTGCGIDHKAYAFRYGKNIADKPLIGCGVIIDGKHAIWVPMEKGNKIKYMGNI